MARSNKAPDVDQIDAVDPDPQSDASPVVEVKVGDDAILGTPGRFVRLPDGSVVSAGQTYTFQHEGEHVIDGVTYVAHPAAYVPFDDGDEDAVEEPTE